MPASYQENLTELILSSTSLQTGRRIPLPSWGFNDQGNFNDDGHLELSNTSARVTIDIDSASTTLQPFVGIRPWTYEAARGGRNAIAGAYVGQDWVVAEILPNGAMGTVYFRFPGGMNVFPLHSDIMTTQCGRTFLGAGVPLIVGTPGWTTSRFLEIDHENGGLIEHSPPGGFPVVFDFMEDPGRRILYARQYTSPTRMNTAVYDLQSTQQLAIHPAAPYTLASAGGWYPTNRLALHPPRPRAGSAVTAHWSMGADPGDLAAVFFLSSRVGGNVINGQAFLMGTGHADRSGLFRLSTVLDPVSFPMAPGDAFFFEGFRLDAGFQLHRSGPVEMVWQ